MSSSSSSPIAASVSQALMLLSQQNPLGPQVVAVLLHSTGGQFDSGQPRNYYLSLVRHAVSGLQTTSNSHTIMAQ